MKVLFYTATCYLDTSVEIIKILKKVVELHVIIEITPDSQNHTISEVECLPENKVLATPEEIFKGKVLKNFEIYFAGTKSVYFAVHAKKGAIASARVNFAACKYIRKIKPDVLHLEAMLFRSLGLIPALLWCKKLAIGVHDPLPHSGERDWKIDLVRKIYFNYPISKVFFFYSQFAREQFKGYYENVSSPMKSIKMGPLSYFRNYRKEDTILKEHVLFFGRISKYKGIDTLLDAIPLVLEKLPMLSFKIAGRTINGYTPNESLITKYKNNITIINKHIENDELVDLIERAMVVICPYKDATQSGVLMTAMALNTPVIATDVGSFPEYIDNNKNGVLVPVSDPIALAQSIVKIISNGTYVEMEQLIKENNVNNSWEENKTELLTAYSKSVWEI